MFECQCVDTLREVFRGCYIVVFFLVNTHLIMPLMLR